MCDRGLAPITEFALSGGSMIDDPLGFSEPVNYNVGRRLRICVARARIIAFKLLQPSVRALSFAAFEKGASFFAVLMPTISCER